jgi:putative membrane protein
MLHAGDGMGWWMLWGGLMMILFWGAIIGLVVWAVQSITCRSADDARPPESGIAPPTPLDIAKERYARGEIDHDEFERMRRDLS